MWALRQAFVGCGRRNSTSTLCYEVRHTVEAKIKKIKKMLAVSLENYDFAAREM